MRPGYLRCRAPRTGANLIIETGKPVMCLGGFTGSDQVLNVTSLENYIHEDKVRYFETGGAGERWNGRREQRDLFLGKHPLHGSSRCGVGRLTTGTANQTGSDSLSLPGMTGSPGTMTGAGFPSGTGNATATVGGMSGNPGGGSGTLYDCLGAA